MAGTSLLALIDDIASLLDDVAAMSKVAARKTASVLGDDLALNAQQISGVSTDRELPVVWAVAKGSLINKVILVPLALLISAFIPAAIVPLLMIGGAYLCYEGCEKLAHTLLHAKSHDPEAIPTASVQQPVEVDIATLEQQKIKGAVRTDFILSAEIIVISLGSVAGAPFIKQVAVLTLIAFVMTVGVYGLVAAIVRLDDAGLYLRTLPGKGALRQLLRQLGNGIIYTAPLLMKTLSILGTAAMFLVGGSILTHGVPWLHHLITTLTNGYNGLVTTLIVSISDLLVGIVAGTVVLAVVMLGTKLWQRNRE